MPVIIHPPIRPFPWRSSLTVVQPVRHVSHALICEQDSVSMQICWCGCLTAALCLVSLLALFLRLFPSSTCCLSVAHSSRRVGEVIRLQSFSIILKILILSTAAGLKSVLLYAQVQTVQTVFQMASVSNYQVLSQPAVARRDDRAVWVLGIHGKRPKTLN